MMPIPLLAGLALAASLAVAGPPPVFSVHDLDRDGYLDRKEYAALCAERQAGRHRAGLLEFDVLDADRDGRIGEDELLNALGRRYRGGRGWRH